jgi:hypothetical protein
VSVIAEKSGVMKQSRGACATVGMAATNFTNKNLLLGISTPCSLKLFFMKLSDSRRAHCVIL